MAACCSLSIWAFWSTSCCSFSTIWNFAVWPIIAVASTGLVGSWYFSCATSSFRKVSLPMSSVGLLVRRAAAGRAGERLGDGHARRDSRGDRIVHRMHLTFSGRAEVGPPVAGPGRVATVRARDDAARRAAAGRPRGVAAGRPEPTSIEPVRSPGSSRSRRRSASPSRSTSCAAASGAAQGRSRSPLADVDRDLDGAEVVRAQHQLEGVALRRRPAGAATTCRQDLGRHGWCRDRRGRGGRPGRRRRDRPGPGRARRRPAGPAPVRRRGRRRHRVAVAGSGVAGPRSRRGPAATTVDGRRRLRRRGRRPTGSAAVGGATSAAVGTVTPGTGTESPARPARPASRPRRRRGRDPLPGTLGGADGTDGRPAPGRSRGVEGGSRRLRARTPGQPGSVGTATVGAPGGSDTGDGAQAGDGAGDGGDATAAGPAGRRRPAPWASGVAASAEGAVRPVVTAAAGSGPAGAARGRVRTVLPGRPGLAVGAADRAGGAGLGPVGRGLVAARGRAVRSSTAIGLGGGAARRRRPPDTDRRAVPRRGAGCGRPAGAAGCAAARVTSGFADDLTGPPRGPAPVPGPWPASTRQGPEPRRARDGPPGGLAPAPGSAARAAGMAGALMPRPRSWRTGPWT